MSQSSTSLLFKAGLLVATVLVTIPTRLHAETNLSNSPALQSQTSIAPKPLTTPPVSIVPAIVENIQWEVIQPQLDILALTETSNATLSVVAPIATQPTVAPAVVAPIATQPTIAPTVVAPAAKSETTASTSKTPVIEVVNLVLNLNEKQVYVYKGDKLVTKYPVAIGKKGWETPTGEWEVMEKITNPGWTSFKNGKVVKSGSQSPLGQRWIGFWTDGKDMIGFHGTSDVKSIGKAASHGCVRMLNKHVKALFPLVKVGTTVKVVSE